MVEHVTVTYKGRIYVWDGKRWYGADDYTIPPLAIQVHLNHLARQQLAEEDARITDPKELANRARAAGEAGQIERAKALADKAYALDPERGGGICRFDDDLYGGEFDQLVHIMRDITRACGATVEEMCEGRFLLHQPVSFYRGYIRGLATGVFAFERNNFQVNADQLKLFSYTMILRAGIALDHLMEPFQDEAAGTVPFRSSRGSRHGLVPIHYFDEDPQYEVIRRYHEVYRRGKAGPDSAHLDQMRESFNFDKAKSFYEGYIKALIQLVLALEDRNFIIPPVELLAIRGTWVARILFLTDRLMK